MLKLEDIRVRIGSVEAVRGFSMEIAAGELVGLAGRNGAGKTTVMRTVMGITRLVGGRVTYDGVDISGVPIHRRAGLGIGYMPETRGLIADLTVEENILLPTWTTGADGPARLALVYGIMPELREMARRKALLLSGGQQKLVALARALSVGHRLLLLDEPFEGVAPALAQRLSEVISTLKSERLSILMSMSEMTHVEALLDRAWGIERGANAKVVHAT
jgi:branched-chain amino acid transport system ATP-binding protein